MLPALSVLPLWKISIYMSAFDWFRINNKCGFRLANRFRKCKFLKFFITKNNWVTTNEFAVIPIFLPSKSLLWQCVVLFFSLKKAIHGKDYTEQFHSLNKKNSCGSLTISLHKSRNQCEKTKRRNRWQWHLAKSSM